MKVVQIIMMGLAGLYLVFVGLTAMVGMFADGGSIWERALLSGVHPIGALALIVLVFNLLIGHKWVTLAAVALLLMSIAGDLAAYFAITSGAIKGDAWLPLSFAVLPALGVIYTFIRGVGAGLAVRPGLGR